MKRKSFFKQFLKKVAILYEGYHNRPYLSLGELENLPKASFLKIKPKVIQSIQVDLEKNWVVGIFPNKKESVRLFEVNPTNTGIFNQFDGKHTLKSIMNSLAQQNHLNVDSAYLEVRVFFLGLLKKGICRPINSI